MIWNFNGRKPVVDPTAYVVDNATVVGSVRLSAQSSVWFQSVVRGDNDWIIIGEGSNIQDGAVLHTDAGIVLDIGPGVTVGHKAMVHGCKIGKNTLVGINAVILNNAVIGENCLIGANALVTEGKVIPDGSLVLGSPGKVVRQLTPEEIEHNRYAARHYMEKARLYPQQLTPFR